LMPPALKVTVIETAKAFRRPGIRVYAVRDGVHLITGEHPTRSPRVALGHSIDELAEIQCEARHVQDVLSGERLDDLQIDRLTQHPANELVGEPVVACFDRRVRRESAA